MRNKYNAVKTEIDGIIFDSKKEAKRYCELKLLVKANEIYCLELQPRYDIVVNGQKVCFYRADFRYKESNDYDAPWIVEDVKSKITAKLPVYRLKKKLVKAIHNVDIIEIK